MITLATLHKATTQEVFDQVARHLLTQNKRAVGTNNACLYYTPEGLRCAAGCLMTRDEYVHLIRRGHSRYSWSRLVRAGNAPLMHMSLIENLQHIHDHKSPDAWTRWLRNTAKVYNLNTNVLEEFRQ